MHTCGILISLYYFKTLFTGVGYYLYGNQIQGNFFYGSYFTLFTQFIIGKEFDKRVDENKVIIQVHW